MGVKNDGHNALYYKLIRSTAPNPDRKLTRSVPGTNNCYSRFSGSTLPKFFEFAPTFLTKPLAWAGVNFIFYPNNPI